MTHDSRPEGAQAGNRTRTGDLNLGKVALYQLSYARTHLQAGEGAAKTRAARQRSHGESNPGLHLERVAS
jgi:hypothetical protein